jgi:DNA-binding NarL/FixJ family response regulator
MKKKKIFIVDDHPLVCNTLVHAIRSKREYQSCGIAHNITEAEQQARSLKPDLMIMDISLPDGNGVELIKRLNGSNQLPLTLVFSAYDENIYAEHCLSAGARGYVMKTAPIDTVLAAIGKIFNGEVSVSEKIATHIIGNLTQRTKKNFTRHGVEQLSGREMNIYQLIGQGFSTKEMADMIRISAKTVEVYRTRIMKKLQLKGNSALVVHATAWALSGIKSFQRDQ